MTACFSAAVGRYGYWADRCSDAKRPNNEFPSEERTSFVSVVSSANLLRSASSEIPSCDVAAVPLTEAEAEVKEGCVKHATSTGWRVVLGGNDNRESNADKAVGVGILLGGVVVVERGAKVMGVVDMVRDDTGVAR